MDGFIPMFGYSPNPEGTDAFLASLERPTLTQAGPHLSLDETRDVFLGQYLLGLMPSWKRWAQPIGSCVGWGWAFCCDVLACCDIAVRGESEAFGGRVLEASVYGFSRVEVPGKRNLGGDGSYGGAAAKAVTRFGTLHYGIDYGGKVFTKPSGTQEREWGRDGVPDSLEKDAAKRKVEAVTLVKNFEDAAKAIQNGLPVAVCSMQGFSMTLRDGGYLTPAGTWAHCMAFAGVRWKPWPALLCVNSWGDCYSGDVDKSLPTQFQRSSGWVRAETCTRMLMGEDSFALAGYTGFEPRQLPDWTGGSL